MRVQTGNLHLLNTTIIPAAAPDGIWEVETILAEEAKQHYSAAIAAGDEGWGSYPRSHIGHEATAALLTAAFGSKVEVDRTPWDGAGTALVLQLAGRPPEGKVLTLEEMEAAGYTWRLLQRCSVSALQNLIIPHGIFARLSAAPGTR